MIQNILKLTIISLMFVACSSKPKDVSNEARGEAPVSKTQASMEAKQLAAEQNSQYVTEISFKKGSTELTTASRRKLERLLNSVKDRRQIDEIKVVSWADKGYPTKEQKKLSKDQLQIAEERNQEIKSFLKTRNKNIPIEVHNMAERPSTISRMWGSSDARIKKSLESNGLTQNGMSAKASHSIVFVELK
jgi:hypothetical protein